MGNVPLSKEDISLATILDIARLAGVSKTTVSKVLNDQYGVNINTRESVLAAVKELNYTPNHAARSLVTSKTGVIGVIYDAFNLPVYQCLANFLQHFAAQSGYNLVFCNCNDDFAAKSKYVSYFNGGAADGLILFGSDLRDKDLILKIQAAGIPFLVIENHFDDLTINNILIDNIEGAHQAVQYLIDLGHKKIAHITGNINHRVASDRLNGYLRALQDNQLEFKSEYVIYTNGKQQSGLEGMKNLLALEERPSALFTFNDIIAYEAIDYLLKSGYNIPEDLSIIGFDNISGILNFYPGSISLSSMEQPMEKVAKASLEILVKNINSKNSVYENLIFETALIEGKSCKAFDK